jgi:two-component system CheB/CheR fusion protein
MHSQTNSTKEPSSQFPVVGIGASAGGLAAFKLFIQSIPEKSNMAYVFVQHLSPAHESNLTEILQKLSPIPVELIHDNVKLQPDHIYVIPPDRALIAVDGTLKVEPIENNRIKTIDLFFSSLGVVHQDFAVGVILSGTLHDGTIGLQAIKANGGLTFAQNEDAAAFNSMPKYAIDSGAVDFVLPAEQIIPKLISINHPFGTEYSKLEENQNRPEDDEEAYKELLTVLRLRKGVDFNNYRQSTVKRRIARRMALNKIERPFEYLAFLRESKNEQDALYNDMLISVTNFFRDRKFFELLCGIILPGLLTDKGAGEPLRIWVAGCATGEEAYTFAICILEYLGDKRTDKKIQIFATDVSESAIGKARLGKYKESEMVGLSTTQIQKYFNKVDGGFQVSKPIRDICVFANHNLLKDPPFSNIDLVSCRNVLIYFEPVLQKRALATFHYGLNQKGYLVLGKSESIGSSTDLFEPSYLPEKVYQAKGIKGRYRHITSPKSEQTMTDHDKGFQDHGDKNLQTAVQELLLKDYTPPAVIVNSNFEVVDFRGKTDTWLFVPPGKPSFNILKLAREGLSFEIRNLLHLAKTKNASARKEGIFFQVNSVQQYVDVEVAPVLEANEEHFLILFQKNNSFILDHDKGTEIEYSGSLQAYIARNEQLEKELTQTREDMRAITEAQEAANEELQSANEELLSGNEELQSLNEELESSKEELQSTNEEITIINTELLDRNEQLSNSRKYTEEIFNTIHDPLLILDESLKVLRASEGYYQLFKTREDTEGQYFYDLNNKVWDLPELRTQLERTLPEQGFFKEFEVEGSFRLIGRKIMMLTARQYQTHNQETLTLLAIHDITDKRKVEKGLAEAERLLAESRERLQFAVDSADVGAWDFNPFTKELIFDKKCKQLHGLPSDASLTYSELIELIEDEDRRTLERAIETTLQQSEDGEFNVLYRVYTPGNVKPKWLKLKGKAYFNQDNVATRMVGTVVDNTIEKTFEEETNELLRKKDEFISIASHELKTPITSIKALLQVLERSMQKNDPETSRMMVHKATRQVNKLVDLVTELLDVTKIHAGKLDLHKTNFSIIQLIEECAEQVSDKNKRQHLQIQGSEEISIHADRTRIEQVIMNLINNAIKYSPKSDHISISVTEEEKHVKITITDHGIGIPKDKIPRIFERFFRVQENTRSFAGLGLGLYISAEIIKRHHGQMGLDSEVDKGSTFWFTIPKLEEPPALVK